MHCRCDTVVPPHGTIFDVGGGNGFVSLALHSAGMKSILVEPGIQGVINARARGLNPVVCSTLENAGFRDGIISAIGLFDVVEHIENDNEFLATIRKLLMPDGLLYLTCPAYKTLWSVVDDFAGHYRRYTISLLTEKLTRNGFDIEYATYIFSFLPFPTLILRSIPSRLKLIKSYDIEQEKKAHIKPGGLLGSAFEIILEVELWALNRKLSIPFGGSCLVVARAS